MITVSYKSLQAALLAPPFPRQFTVLGYKTPEQARTYFAGDRRLFDDIEEWLEDHLPGARSMSARSELQGSLHIAIADRADEVTFKLAWGEDILGR